MSSSWGPSLPAVRPLAQPANWSGPGEQVTPADVVSMVAQRLDLAGTPPPVDDDTEADPRAGGGLSGTWSAPTGTA